MKYRALIVYVTLTLVFAAPSVQSQSWYPANMRIPLTIVSSLYRVRISDASHLTHVQSELDALQLFVHLDKTPDPGNFYLLRFDSTSCILELLRQVKQISGIVMVEPCYRKQNGQIAAFTCDICVALDPARDRNTFDSLVSYYGLRITTRPGSGLRYILTATRQMDRSVVDVANELHDLEVTRWAHPEQAGVLAGASYNLYDYYNQFQAHVKKVIGTFNTSSVWDFYGVNGTMEVAILDDGFDDHEDISDSRILWSLGYDYADGDWDVTPAEEVAHGMSCAGILLAGHWRVLLYQTYDKSWATWPVQAIYA